MPGLCQWWVPTVDLKPWYRVDLSKLQTILTFYKESHSFLTLPLSIKNASIMIKKLFYFMVISPTQAFCFAIIIYFIKLKC